MGWRVLDGDVVQSLSLSAVPLIVVERLLWRHFYDFREGLKLMSFGFELEASDLLKFAFGVMAMSGSLQRCRMKVLVMN